MRTHSDERDDDPQVPEKLRGAIVRLYEPPPAVPAELDSVVLREARSSYARRRNRWIAARWAGAGLAAAAALGLALHVFVARHGIVPPPSPTRQVARLGDIDANGRVDILDAYVVARAIARHQPLDPAWDVNGDGAIDQKDVDLIAHMAVRITPEATQ